MFEHAAEQPISVEIKIAPGLFVKSMQIQKAGTIVPQHSHATAHLSMLAVGRVRAWRDGALLGDFQAPQGILIEAGTKHAFMSLEDNTIIYCIHAIGDSGEVEIVEEHQIVGNP